MLRDTLREGRPFIGDNAEPLAEADLLDRPKTGGMAGPRVRRTGRLARRLALGWLALVVFAGVFADFLPLADNEALVRALPSRTKVGWRWPEPLGTDFVGRSMLSRIVYGARPSLLVGVFAALAASVVGTTVGLIAGFRRGAVDKVVTLLLDSLLAFPPLVILLAIVAVADRGLGTLIFGLGLLGIPMFARITRANTMTLSTREHVLAARAMGATKVRIVTRELLPGVLLPVSSILFLFMAVAIVAEGSLSFLGVGIPPPTPSWGGMVNEGRSVFSQNAYLIVPPSVCIALTVLSLNVIADDLRRRFQFIGGGER